MQSSSVILILVLCLMGGLTAYLADLLGRTLGKKRLTIGHMRPKHTAALLTTTAGIFIPLITLGLMSLLFSDVREMLFRTQEIKRELGKVEGELRVNQARLNERAKQVAELEDQQTKLRAESDRLRTTTDKAQKDLGVARGQLGNTRKQLLSSQSQLAVLRNRTASLVKEVAQFSQAVTKNREELARLSADVSVKTNQAKVATDQLNEIYRRNVEIEAANRELEAGSRVLEAVRVELTRQVEDLKESAQSVRDSLAAVNDQLADSQRQLQLLKVQQAALAQTLQETWGTTRVQPLIYNRNEEVARWTLGAGSSRAEAESALNSLLQTAGVRAGRRGAKSSPGTPTADFFDDSEVPRRIQVDQVLAAATSQREPVVMIAQALFNSFKDEELWLRVVVEKNSIVYRPGQVISEVRIDGGQTDRQVLAAISSFIRDRVGPKALEDGMIPATGSEAPLGEVDDDQIVSLMRMIRDYGRMVRVQALVTTETRRADRLQLEFRLR